MACLGQLRVAPSGQVTGLDMAAALMTAQVSGYDADTVSELLQEAESVMIPLLNSTPDNG
jgi:hypothetical protein